jgi:hypothetical protein
MKKGALVYKGKMFRCTRCGIKWASIEPAEAHFCEELNAKQKQEDAHILRKETHPEDKRDAMYHMQRILTERLPRD